MTSPLAVVGLGLAVLAGLLHVVIFAFESVLWTRPRIWKRFGLRTKEEAEITQPLAYNQGFYNLFLAVGAILGPVLVLTGALAVPGVTLTIVATGSMLLAALVLVTSNPRLARAAATQGTVPLLSLGFVAAALLT